MKHPDELLSSFDKSWVDFSEAWKKARAKGSEKSIHVLRVSTRRLIATLELTRTLSKHDEMSKLQTRFKKIFKEMGFIRDLQVQLKNLSHLRQAGPVVDFKRSLQRRERREIADIPSVLKRAKRRRLMGGVKEVRSEFVRLHNKLGDRKIQSSIERLLRLRRTEFLKARRHFKPSDDETLHEMRIALKKLRYAVEAAQPVLGNSVKKRVENMHTLQTLLGDTRDLELLRIRLEKWATKRGKKIAIVPALESLQEKRAGLMEKIVASSADLENVFPEATLKPVAEKTLAPPANVVPERNEARA